MTDADLAKLEKELKLKLPASYRKIVRNFPAGLRDWPPRPENVRYDRRDDFLLDVPAILKANREGRKILRKKFPPKAFVYGGDATGYWLIDTSHKNPPPLLIHDDYLIGGFQDLDEHFAAIVQGHKEALANVKKRAKAGPKATLSPEDLIAEGRKLTRPAVALYDKGSKYAAVWRGTGVASPGPGEWRHWISIDTKFLPDNPRKLKGVVSLYDWFADDDRMGELKVVHDARATLPKMTDGTKLYAKNFDCLPDVDAVFRFGSKKIEDWLKAVSWNPNTGYEQSPVKEYLKLVHSVHPFMTHDGAYAMLGGWSWCFTWCYGIDEEYPWDVFQKPLVVLTLAESEPWLEVFDAGKKFVTFSRIT